MNALEYLASQMEWVANDTAYNLDFVPADKLNWKPAPSAKSVLEIVRELGIGPRKIGAILEGTTWDPAPEEITSPATIAEGKELLQATARAYVQTLRRLDATNLDRRVDLGFGPLPLLSAAGIPITEFVHHRGQIVYIQTLLGDTEDHFDMSAF